ncbi:hypothetical protein SynBIOSE41_02386 [Synechococcus sp. BIOS-E4-1]|nr:hypothetical protein SynBIOSE41_02386 [Synechococcus sp. BIOS-E4-1]
MGENGFNGVFDLLSPILKVLQYYCSLSSTLLVKNAGVIFIVTIL